VLAAAELFVRDGYDATSMSKLATHAGVTANTLYWYFRDKDELLVAVADRYLVGLLRRHTALADKPLAAQLRWLVKSLRPVRHLVTTVHNRVAVSESVAAWHSGFHRSIEALVERQLPGPVPADRRAAEAAAATFALEGALTHDLDATTTEQLCDIIAERLHRAVAPDPAPPAKPQS
jgi:AcrR family transcriptional regulator